MTLRLIFLANLSLLPYPAPAMTIHAHRSGDESNDRLQQRFKGQVQRTGLMKLLREHARFKRTPNKRLVRLRALKREAYRTGNRKQKFYSNM